MPLSREDVADVQFNDILLITREGHQHKNERVRVHFTKPSRMIAVSICGERKVLKYDAFDITTPKVRDSVECPALPSPKVKKVKAHKKKEEREKHSTAEFEQLKTTAGGRAVCESINQFGAL